MKVFKLVSRLLIGSVLCAKFVSPQENNVQLIEEEPELVFDVPHVHEEISINEEVAEEDAQDDFSLIEFVRRSRENSDHVDHNVRGQRRRRLDGDDDDDDDDDDNGKGKGAPTRRPTKKPSRRPTKKPTRKPTKKPTKKPTRRPTSPTKKPTRKPSTRKPTRRPTKKPTRKPRTRKPRTRKPRTRKPSRSKDSSSRSGKGKGKGGDSRRLGSDSEDYSITEEHHNGVRARRFLESLDFNEEEEAYMDTEYDTLRKFVDENIRLVHD